MAEVPPLDVEVRWSEPGVVGVGYRPWPTWVIAIIFTLIGMALGAAMLTLLAPPGRSLPPQIVVKTEKPEVEPPPPGPEGRKRTAKIGNSVIEYDQDAMLEIELTGDHNQRGDAGIRDESVTTGGVGASFEGKDMKQDFNPDPATANLSGGKGRRFVPTGGTGGGAKYSGEIWGGSSINIFYVFGALFIAGGGLYYVMKTMGSGIPIPGTLRTALSIAGVGLVFIAVGVTIEQFPQIWIAAAVALMAVLGMWAYNAYKNAQKTAKSTNAIDHMVLTTTSGKMAEKMLTDTSTNPVTVKPLRDWIRSSFLASPSSGGGKAADLTAAVDDSKKRMGV